MFYRLIKELFQVARERQGRTVRRTCLSIYYSFHSFIQYSFHSFFINLFNKSFIISPFMHYWSFISFLLCSMHFKYKNQGCGKGFICFLLYFQVIFIDEIDSICRKRSAREEEHTRRIKTELLKQVQFKWSWLKCMTNYFHHSFLFWSCSLL